ncbi:MAG: YciI family protein [Ignavibacteriaceae bacterium]
MKNLTIALSFLLILSFTSFAQEEPDYEMKTYYMVFLKKGQNRSQDSTAAANLQKGHMDNIERLAKEGKLNVAGPFLDDGELRGIFIMDVSSKEEAEELVKTDPAVIAGRLSYEIHPWMTAKGTCFK